MTIVKGLSFSLTPTSVTTISSYSISSGSLPSGLSLNSNTGVISGTPTTIQTKTATIKATTSSTYYTFDIMFNVIDNPTSCSSSKVLVTFNRITKSYSSEESSKVYQGSSTSGTLLFTQPTVFDSQTYSWNICLSSGDYTLQLLN